jgi:hypothetical protein
MVSGFLRGEVPMSAALVKELRERTGLGLLECKRALATVGGDVELAIEELWREMTASWPLSKALLMLLLTPGSRMLQL